MSGRRFVHSDGSPRTNEHNFPLAIAVAGCGYWGSKHVRILYGLTEVREVVIVDSDPRIRTAMVSAFPGVRAFADLGAALPHVDAVIIATPPRSHAGLTLEALRSGKHVLV